MNKLYKLSDNIMTEAQFMKEHDTHGWIKKQESTAKSISVKLECKKCGIVFYVQLFYEKPRANADQK